MNKPKLFFGVLLIVTLVALLAGVGLGGMVVPALGAGQTAEEIQAVSSAPADESLDAAQPSAGGQDPLILSYAAKFVCLEPLQAGMVSYKTAVPIVQERTDVLVHNPNDFPVTFYKKAVRARLEDIDPEEPGDWVELDLDPDYALRINCDDIAGLLTGNPSATFLSTYGIGARVEGFVVIGIGPQTTASGDWKYGRLDVTAEYSRSSEVLKKDISYQPWWRYWWWDLPWYLGYPYQRIIPVDATSNIDCKGLLYDALVADATDKLADKELEETLAALAIGQEFGPGHQGYISEESDPPALVALIGHCGKIMDATGIYAAAVDYVVVSNKGYTDPNPITGVSLTPTAVLYPWIPGHWYDTTVVMPQNVDVDLDTYLHLWATQRWVDAGANVDLVPTWMNYYFPWWCGWGYWHWWWQGDDCVDIGVGEGESIDVEQITPVRVFMSKWPPSP